MDEIVADVTIPDLAARGFLAVAVRDGVTVVRGWLPADPAEPGATPEVVLDLEGTGLLVVPADAARDDPGLPGGVHPFAWRPPGAGTPRRLRAHDLRTGEELPGSPATIGGDGVVPRPGAPLSRWPRGLSGHAGGAVPAEIATGLWASVTGPAHSFRFDLLPDAAGAAVPARGARIATEVPAGRIVLHARPVGAMPPPGLVTSVRVEAWLPEATEPAMQAIAEIWLTRRAGGDFTLLRRLRRTRLFRLPSGTGTELALTEEEAEGEGELLVTLVALGAKGLAARPPVIGDPPEEAARTEDPRLERSFDALREMIRLTAGTAGADTPLLPPSAVPHPLPAEPLGAEHPPTLVLLPVRDGGAIVRDGLRALASAATGPMEVLILDDGSRGFTAEMLREEARGDPRFALHRRDVNRGYTKSVNEGLLLRPAPWTVILNSDALVTRGWLDRLHAAARARPGTGMVGPLSNAATWQSIPAAKRADGGWSTNDLIEPRHRERVQALLSRASERAYPEFPILNGFCTLIAGAVFDRAGLFDDDAFPMGYGEETDLCLRARAAGFRLTVADDCFVYHHKSVSFGSANRARLSRAGGLELTNKHPGANIAGLEAAMGGHPAMARLRARMTDLLAELD